MAIGGLSVQASLNYFNEVFDGIYSQKIPSWERIENPQLKSARLFFKKIDPKYKTIDSPTKLCWEKYRATMLGISDKTYRAYPTFVKFTNKFPLERYLAEHRHELKEANGQLFIKHKNNYVSWNDAYQIYKTFPKCKGDFRQKSRYGEAGIQKINLYDWVNFEPYKKDNPAKWDKKYIFEYCVTCTPALLRMSGDHSWFRLKDPQGNVYSVGKNLAAKIGKGIKKILCPLRAKDCDYQSPDVSEYWPQTIYSLPVEITRDHFEAIKDSVRKDKLNRMRTSFQVFKNNCQEYVNEKARMAGLCIPTSCSISRLLVSEKTKTRYARIMEKFPKFLKIIFDFIGIFFVNLLLAILGNGYVDSRLKGKVKAHLSFSTICNREKLSFHPPAYVAHKVFPKILEWRKQDPNRQYRLPPEYYTQVNSKIGISTSSKPRG